MSSGKIIHVGFLLQDTGAVYGAERATLDLMRGLGERSGFRVSVILIDEMRLGNRHGIFRQAIRENGHPVEICSTDHRFSPALAKGIRRIVRERKIDILHCTGAKASFHAYLAAPTKLSSTVHGWGVDRSLKACVYDFLERWVLRRFDGVVVLSRFYESLLRGYGFDMDKVDMIRPGPGFAGFPENRRAADRTGPCVAGLPARFSPEKNHDLLLDAAGILAAEGSKLRFLLAGDGTERSRIANRVRREGLSDRVELPGFLDRSEFFNRVDLLVLCSLVENQPYAILEAMACGVPVVATDAGGVAEMIEDGETGLLVAPQSAEALASALASLCGNPAECRRLGRQAREYFNETYRQDRCIDQYVNYYRQLAGSTE
jgi:glycosyltransferase involved in cell wall biosynthesis